MPITLFESGAKAKDEKESGRARFSTMAGVVTNNTDCIMVGKVLIRIPALDQEVWARLTSTGAGAGTGHFQPPNINDEVLVALNDNDPDDAFVIGGLWSTLASPPISLPTDVLTKRVIRTGLTRAIGHEIEFDDGPAQSIKITTSLLPLGQQTFIMDPTGIQLKNLAGTIKIALDNLQQTITIQAKNIDLNAGQIRMTAGKIDITGVGETTIKGGMVRIN